MIEIMVYAILFALATICLTLAREITVDSAYIGMAVFLSAELIASSIKQLQNRRD